VQVPLLELLGLVRVADQTRRHGAGLQEARRPPGVRVVAIRTIARRSRMLHLGRRDLLRHFLVAHHAQGLHIFLRQHNLPVYGRRMAGVALLAFKRIVQERLHQLRGLGLVRIMTLKAVGFGEGLILVGLDHRRIFHIVTVKAQLGRVFGQVIRECALRGVAGLVSDVACLATHVERGMPAASLGDVHAHAVTRQAEVLLLRCSRGRLQQLVLVFRRVRIVAFEAFADSRAVDFPFDRGGFLVSVAGEAKVQRGGGD